MTDNKTGSRPAETPSQAGKPPKLSTVVDGLIKDERFVRKVAEVALTRSGSMDAITKALIAHTPFWNELDETTPGAVVGGEELADEMSEGHIVIEPFNPTAVGSSWYGLTLGSSYFRAKAGQTVIASAAETVRGLWGSLQQATISDGKNGVPAGQQYITLAPGELIMGYSQEFVGGREHLTTMIRTPRNLYKIGADVCGSGGLTDIGDINRQMLIISNRSPSTILLIVGERIAQLMFLRTGYLTTDAFRTMYPAYDAKQFEQFRAQWRPEHMLPGDALPAEAKGVVIEAKAPKRPVAETKEEVKAPAEAKADPEPGRAAPAPVPVTPPAKMSRPPPMPATRSTRPLFVSPPPPPTTRRG